MIRIFIIVLILLLCGGIVVAVMLLKKKRGCSCLGKSCKTDTDCASCCDTTTCLNGKCCSTDCSRKSCDQNNSCGQSCQSNCSLGQTCFQGNCCTPNCAPNTCSGDGCGGDCKCDTGYTCVTDSHGVKSCCKAPDCSSGFCGTTPCGSCKCNDDYCTGGCCKLGTCTYKDICKNNPNFGKILGSNWAKFCNTCNDPEDHCDLILPQFYRGSFIPTSGTIKCSSCQRNNVPDTAIDNGASYYDYDKTQSKIVPYFISNYCGKNDEGVCDGKTCTCITDADCVARGCTTCLGGFCN